MSLSVSEEWGAELRKVKFGLELEWVERPANGMSGALLILWKTGVFKIKISFIGEIFVGICAD